MSDPYLELYNNFRWNLPERFNFATDVVDRHARDAARPALLWCDEQGHEGTQEINRRALEAGFGLANAWLEQAAAGTPCLVSR